MRASTEKNCERVGGGLRRAAWGVAAGLLLTLAALPGCHGSVVKEKDVYKRQIEVAQRIEPEAADLAAYKTGYAKWRKLYPALESLE